tara:strand:+ start:607 stop:936 length:330 start_codon:yes stop_codon:yes gene_type:complete
MTTKLPSKIDFSYFTLTIKYLEPLIAEEIGEQQGSFHTKALVIYVDQEIIDEGGVRAVSLVIHEIFHAIYYDKNLDGANEERTVNSYANGLTELFSRNPKFRKWVMEQF